MTTFIALGEIVHYEQLLNPRKGSNTIAMALFQQVYKGYVRHIITL